MEEFVEGGVCRHEGVDWGTFISLVGLCTVSRAIVDGINAPRL